MAISNRLKTIAELVTPGFRAADIGTDHGYVPVYLLRNGLSPYVIAADLSPASLKKAVENARRAGFLLLPEEAAEESCEFVQGTEAAEESCEFVQGTEAAEENCEFVQGTEAAEENCEFVQDTETAEENCGFVQGTEAAEEGCGAAKLHGICCRLSDGLSKVLPGEVDAIIISGMGGILMDRILRAGIETVKAAKELILSPHRDADLLRSFAEEFGFEIEKDFELPDKKKCYAILKIRIPERTESAEDFNCKSSGNCL